MKKSLLQFCDKLFFFGLKRIFVNVCCVFDELFFVVLFVTICDKTYFKK